MPSSNLETLTSLAPLLESRCAEVLESMYFASVIETAPADEPLADAGLGFSLAFAGDLQGSFGVTLTPETARTLAANFLGDDEETLTPEAVAEVTGELANMLCGAVLSRVPSHDVFTLSHPEPVHSFALASEQASEHHARTLQTDLGPISVWIAVTPLTPPTAAQD